MFPWHPGKKLTNFFVYWELNQIILKLTWDNKHVRVITAFLKTKSTRVRGRYSGKNFPEK